MEARRAPLCSPKRSLAVFLRMSLLLIQPSRLLLKVQLVCSGSNPSNMFFNSSTACVRAHSGILPPLQCSLGNNPAAPVHRPHFCRPPDSSGGALIASARHFFKSSALIGPAVFERSGGAVSASTAGAGKKQRDEYCESRGSRGVHSREVHTLRPPSRAAENACSGSKTVSVTVQRTRRASRAVFWSSRRS
jgi:hypothetical protein